MGFSCTIMIKGRDLTKYEGGEISCKLFGLGPNGSEQTSAPYRLEDFRDIVCRSVYGDKLKEAAQDSFRALQAMAKDNLNSLKPNHCGTCSCGEEVPFGWSKEAIEKLLSINPNDITYLSGGY